MHSTIHGARSCAQLSRRERQRLARARAFSRRTPAVSQEVPAVVLERAEVELIGRLVRCDRTAVSSALLAVGGLGASVARRRAVLARVDEVASQALAEGAISAGRAAQIARHVRRALDEVEADAAA